MHTASNLLPVKSIAVHLRYFIDNQSITISKVLTYLVKVPYSFSVTACIKLHNYPLFKDAESQCMQYSVSLYCEEQVKFDQKIKPKVTIKQSFQEFSFGYDEVRKADIHTDILCNLVLDKV